MGGLFALKRILDNSGSPARWCGVCPSVIGYFTPSCGYHVPGTNTPTQIVETPALLENVTCVTDNFLYVPASIFSAVPLSLPVTYFGSLFTGRA